MKIRIHYLGQIIEREVSDTTRPLDIYLESEPVAESVAESTTESASVLASASNVESEASVPDISTLPEGVPFRQVYVYEQPRGLFGSDRIRQTVTTDAQGNILETQSVNLSELQRQDRQREKTERQAQEWNRAPLWKKGLVFLIFGAFLTCVLYFAFSLIH